MKSVLVAEPRLFPSISERFCLGAGRGGREMFSLPPSPLVLEVVSGNESNRGHTGGSSPSQACPCCFPILLSPPLTYRGLQYFRLFSLVM